MNIIQYAYKSLLKTLGIREKDIAEKIAGFYPEPPESFEETLSIINIDEDLNDSLIHTALKAYVDEDLRNFYKFAVIVSNYCQLDDENIKDFLRVSALNAESSSLQAAIQNFVMKSKGIVSKSPYSDTVEIPEYTIIHPNEIKVVTRVEEAETLFISMCKAIGIALNNTFIESSKSGRLYFYSFGPLYIECYDRFPNTGGHIREMINLSFDDDRDHYLLAEIGYDFLGIGKELIEADRAVQ